MRENRTLFGQYAGRLESSNAEILEISKIILGVVAALAANCTAPHISSMIHGRYTPPERFYLLDVLRGLAALSAVVWHWPNFLSGKYSGQIDSARLPMSEWIFFLYQKGWLAVDLFFSLSGFVFYWLYSRGVADGGITFRRFALLRFSRLYPLHFATLVAVGVFQLWFINAQGSYFVYSHNDAKHLLLNLGFLSSWGFERGHSFNAPVWSVSVEILLYTVFFICCRILPLRAIVLAVLSIAGFFVLTKYYTPIGRGVGSFFLGGCVFLAYQRAISSSKTQLIARWTVSIAVGAWVATFFAAHLFFNASLPSLQFVPLPLQPGSSVQQILVKVMLFWPTMVLFPLTILALALIESVVGPIGKQLAFIGDISYSSYLLHFPLQLVIVALATRFRVSESIYYSPWFMLLFFSVLVSLSFGSHQFFEIPAQRLIRNNRLASRCFS